jgi:YHS domain-containing protein
VNRTGNVATVARRWIACIFHALASVDPRISASYDGQTYLFPTAEQREMFLAEPAKSTPAMSGGCTVCRVEMGKDIPGSVQFAALHQNRLFLFPGDEQKQMFVKNPAKYEVTAGAR